MGRDPEIVMKFRNVCIILLAMVLVIPACTGGKGRIIPKGRMARISAEMFLADQWIASRNDLGRRPDTMLVYEPIFREYHCTADDYRASRAYYVEDASKYAKIIKKSVLILEKDLKRLKADKVILDKIKGLAGNRDRFRPEKIYSLAGLEDPDVFSEVTFEGDSIFFYVDTTGCDWRFDPLKGVDTLFVGPALVFDEPSDSLYTENNEENI